GDLPAGHRTDVEVASDAEAAVVAGVGPEVPRPERETDDEPFTVDLVRRTAMVGGHGGRSARRHGQEHAGQGNRRSHGASVASASGRMREGAMSAARGPRALVTVVGTATRAR